MSYVVDSLTCPNCLIRTVYHWISSIYFRNELIPRTTPTTQSITHTRPAPTSANGTFLLPVVQAKILVSSLTFASKKSASGLSINPVVSTFKIQKTIPSCLLCCSQYYNSFIIVCFFLKPCLQQSVLHRVHMEGPGWRNREKWREKYNDGSR